MSVQSYAPLRSADYDRMWAEVNDFIRFNPGARHRRRWILDELRSIPFNRLLDAGCGNGELLIAVRKEFPALQTLAGADLSTAVIESNRQRLPGMNFYVLNLEEAQAINAVFDVIICSEVIEHLSDFKLAFRNFSEMLSSGGSLLLTCPTGRVYPTERHFGHTRHPTIKEIFAIATEQNFQMITARNWGFPCYKLLKWGTNLNPEFALKNFASGRYSITSKAVSHFFYFANFLNLPSSPLGCQLLLRLEKRA